MSDSIRKELISILVTHKTNGTLDVQTPRMLREQLAAALEQSIQYVDEYKADIKTWIGEFVNGSTESKKTSTAELRSIAKSLGVPPSFWSGLDKENFQCVEAKLVEFCVTKGIVSENKVPTMKEAKAYKEKREAAAELEGIDSSNIIVSGKRRRCQDILF